MAGQWPQAQARDEPACATPALWLDPASGETLALDRLMASLAKRQVVLLGEVHDEAAHHRWQTYVLAALQAYHPNLVIGFEMFPRSVQPALDGWWRGELSESAFLAQSRWSEVWGMDPALYLPLFHFVRDNRVPMVALNVERRLVSRVAREGWAAVPLDQREGVSDPVPASAGYRRYLAEVFGEKLRRGGEAAEAEGHGAASDAPPDIDAILARDDFARFVQAQLTWDRAMAEALAQARHDHPGALAVGIMGRGHIQFGQGVPQQLADLAVPDVAVLLPLEAGRACDELPADIADAVFLIEPSERSAPPPLKPHLGITIEQADGGLRVQTVAAGSIAERARLAVGDVIVAAAGFPVARRADLIEIVERQAPGTWLPIEIERDGKPLKIVARFPSGLGHAP